MGRFGHTENLWAVLSVPFWFMGRFGRFPWPSLSLFAAIIVESRKMRCEYHKRGSLSHSEGGMVKRRQAKTATELLVYWR